MASVKLFWFAVERAAEPISSALERAAVRSVRCRWLASVNPLPEVCSYRFQRFCAMAARGFTKLQSHHRTSLFAEGPARAEAPLSERAATKMGAELLAEGTVVGLGLAVLYDQHRREVRPPPFLPCLPSIASGAQVAAEEVLEARIVALETAVLAARAGGGT